MPAPLSHARRAQVANLLHMGAGPSDTARRLGVSRQTVHRYRAAAHAQGRAVPQPLPMGGYRISKVQRAHIVEWARLALEQPKRTLSELHELAGPEDVSLATVARALHKSGLRKRRARLVDPKTNTSALVAAERTALRRAQTEDPALAPEATLFYDETFFRLNEQARSAWGLEDDAAPVLFAPKGRTATTGLFLTLGLCGDELVLHVSLRPPQRPFVALSATFEASELEAPGRGADVGLTTSQVHSASRAQLRALLRAHGVKSTDLNTQPQLAARSVQLVSHGPLGLPRAGRADVGGPKLPFRATARDVVRYWQDEFVPWFGEQGFGDLAERTVVWDNASTHSAVQVHDATRVSVFHRLFREWGFRGVVFLPPRSPDLNPAELCFAYLKYWVRRWAPDEGYTQEALEQAIGAAAARVTATMVRNWMRGCGYGAQRGAQRGALRSRVRTARWADARGTLRPADELADLVDVTARRARPAAPLAAPDTARRWSGLDAQPPNLVETRSKSYAEAQVDQQETFEPERIVAERGSGRTIEYKLRWRGYDASADTWEPEEHLLAGRRQLLRDWHKRRRAGVQAAESASGRLERHAD